MLIQLHMLQNYAPSNLNRDDTGSPKDAVFGGYRRGRISSQCLKRSIRHSETFKDMFEADGLLAKRTLELPRLVKEELEAIEVDEQAVTTITKILATLGGGKDAKELKTKLLIFLTTAEVTEVTHKLWEHYQELGDKKFAKLKIAELEKVMAHAAPRSIDVSMFGRMTTSIAFEDVAAAVQVAHALSTNALDREFDYFTAVDDLSGESGAGMIGDVEFNSSTYYKYFNIHWEKLVENLGGDEQTAGKAVTALLEAAALAQPSGKQNSFAAQNLPDLVFVEVSEKNVPVSYANAFLKPVSKFDGAKNSLIDNSIDRLNDCVQNIQNAYGFNNQQAFFAVPNNVTFDRGEDVKSLAGLQAWTAEKIGARSNG